jgi:hypothetical protein
MTELFDASFDLEEVASLAKVDPDFMAALAMPEVFEYAWPPVFKAVWAWLLETVGKERDFSNLALGLPRGFGKSTVIKLFILYCILFTNRQFILVMAETATKAENIISDVFDMLDELNIKTVFGDWRLGVEKDTNSTKKFGFRGRNIIVAALGAGGSVRGLNLKNQRPDVMIFDDVQSREDADSLEVSDKLYKWLLGTALKAKSPKGCMNLFIANMYPTPHSILKKLKGNKYWTKFIAGGILADGTSLWEQLQPIAQLMIEYRRDLESGHPEIFHAEVLNDENASLNNLVDISRVPEYPYLDDDVHAGNYIIIDPATDKVNADAVSLGYFEIHEGEPCARELVEGRFSPADTIKEAIKLCSKWNCALVVIEANSYQYTLKFWSEEICRQMGIIGITFIDIYSGKLSKNSRILTMFKSYTAGEIRCHPTCKSQFHSQIQGFNPLKTSNVDGILDLFTYAPRVLEEFADLIAINTIEGRQEFEAMSNESYTEQDNSPF